MGTERFRCPICDKSIPANQFVGGTCSDCQEKGYWIDPAGGIHYDDPTSDEFEDPARMYE